MTSLLSMGIDLASAKRITYSDAAWLLTAKNDVSSAGTGDGIRDATQADIRKLFG